MLDQFLRTGRGIAFNQMFAMTEYPKDIMPLYAQGYALAEFLIQTGGRRKYVEFLGDGLQNGDWSGAVQRQYGIKDLSTLQNNWLAWVSQGWPSLKPRDAQPAAAGGDMLAVNQPRPRPEPNLIYHVRDQQSPAAPKPGLVPVHIPPLASTASPKGDSPNSHLGENGTVPFNSAGKGQPVRTATAMNWSDPRRGDPPPAARVAAAGPQDKPACRWPLAGTPPASPSRRLPLLPRRRPASIPSASKSRIPNRWNSRGRRCCNDRDERDASVDSPSAQRSALYRP